MIPHRLGDLLVIRKGQAYEAVFVGDEGPYLLGMGVFDPEGGFRIRNLRRYSGPVTDEGRVSPGSVVVATTDMGARVKILGRSAKVPEGIGEFGIVTADMGRVEWRTDSADARAYAYWLMRTEAFRQYCLRFAQGTAVRRVKPRDIEAFPIRDPSEVQVSQAVAALDAVDAKIELNNRLIENLESLTQSVFRGWFIESDSAMVTSGGGQLRRSRHEGVSPRGETEVVASVVADKCWESVPLSDLVDHSRDQDDPRLSPSTLFSHFSIPAYDATHTPASEYGASIKSTKFKVSPGAVLVSKLNPEVNRVWLVDESDCERAIASTEFVVLRPRHASMGSFLYSLVRESRFRVRLQALVTGTSGSHQRVDPKSLLALSVISPPLPAIEAFDRIVGPQLRRIEHCRRETRLLIQLRDALLPRLVSDQGALQFQTTVQHQKAYEASTTVS